jgi:hypothetical protein
MDELLEEIRSLRQQVAALQAAIGERHRVTLRALQHQPFLGQPIDLVATVTHADGSTPRVDVPLTLTTTWGRLRVVTGVELREGSAVTARTDGNGMLHALLLPPLSEELMPEQQASLQVALRRLDPKAATPQDTLDGLRELAREYRLEGSTALRQAIDILFEDFGYGLLDAVNAQNLLLTWSAIDSTVFAHVREDSGDGPDASVVQATAAISLRFRNWLGPWLEVMQEVTRSESRLEDDLLRTTRLQQPDAILGRIYKRLRDFVEDQQGRIGGQVARRVAEGALNEFVHTGVDNLPREAQLALVPSLNIASRTVVASGASVLAAVNQTRTELHREIEQKAGGVDAGRFGELFDRVGRFERLLDQKVDATAFTRFQRDIATQLNTKVDQATFVDFQRNVDLRFERTVNVNTFDTFRTEVNTALVRKADQVVVDRLNADLTNQLDRVRNTSTQLQTDLRSLNTTFTQLDRDVNVLKQRR